MSNSFATMWTVVHQAPTSMEFPRQEYWSGLPFPSRGSSWPRDLLHWQADSLPLSHQGSPYFCIINHYWNEIASLVTLAIPRTIPNPTWWLSGKESVCWCRRCGFNTWSSKVPWRRKWQSTPLLLPGKPHGLRSLPGNRPWGRKESDMT